MNAGFIFFTMVLLLGSAATGIADTIVLKSGSSLEGTITGASDTTVLIRLETTINQVPHADISSLIFTSADILFLKPEATLECKLVNKTGSDVTIVTPKGIETIPNSKISKVEYNVGHELKVASLPPTGPQFMNKPSRFVWTGDFKKNVSLGLLLGTHFARLTDWKDQFSNEEDIYPGGLDIGGEIGYTLNRNLSIGAGYEYFTFQRVKILFTSAEDHVSSSFVYGSLKMNQRIGSSPAFFWYGGGDVGVVNATEEMSANGVDFEATGSVFAFRIKLGAEYYCSGNTSIFTDVRYLFANVTDPQVLGQEVDNYSLDFSGLSFVLGVTFHIPISQ